jgi:predicted Zn-dependent peptidase
MIAEFEKVATLGITPAELELAKGNISGGLALKFESTQARMSRLIGSEIGSGTFVDLDESLRRYQAVTLEDVQSLAADIAARQRSIVAVGDLDESVFESLV